ncbi:MAG: hypothetical protein HUU26_05400 [Gemmatimonadaceae bacterium]|nr:hypothetical protein [Gemmatimonadaceae bacterium]
MSRFSFAKTSSGALLLVAAIYAVSAACGVDVFDPCFSSREQIQSRGQLDGVWVVETVNGAPASNYPLPFPSTDRFVTGSIDFKTRETKGDCRDLRESSGYAVANYLLRDSNGALKPAKRYVGRFTYKHKTNKLTVTAAGYAINGSRSGSTMTLPASHALFGSYTLVLQRGF